MGFLRDLRDLRAARRDPQPEPVIHSGFEDLAERCICSHLDLGHVDETGICLECLADKSLALFQRCYRFHPPPTEENDQ